MVTPVSEAIWMFFAVITVGVVIGQVLEWITSRVVWAGMGDVLGSLVEAVDVVVPFSASACGGCRASGPTSRTACCSPC